MFLFGGLHGHTDQEAVESPYYVTGPAILHDKADKVYDSPCSTEFGTNRIDSGTVPVITNFADQP